MFTRMDKREKTMRITRRTVRTQLLPRRFAKKKKNERNIDVEYCPVNEQNSLDSDTLPLEYPQGLLPRPT